MSPETDLPLEVHVAGLRYQSQRESEQEYADGRLPAKIQRLLLKKIIAGVRDALDALEQLDQEPLDNIQILSGRRTTDHDRDIEGLRALSDGAGRALDAVDETAGPKTRSAALTMFVKRLCEIWENRQGEKATLKAMKADGVTTLVSPAGAAIADWAQGIDATLTQASIAAALRTVLDNRKS